MTTSMGTPSRNLKMFDRVVAVDAVSLLIGPSRGGRRLTNLATRLRPIFRLVLAASILAATLVDPAHAQGSPVYLVTYVSVMPNEVASGATLLERYRDASRKEAGNQRLGVLRETTRPNRFAILEVWKDDAGFMAHDKAASTSATNSKRF
jgi:quinol monooxygenase YgiN